MAYQHGVYIQEQATSIVAPITGTAGLQVIFGTAPVNMTKDPTGAVNAPKIAYSYAEAVAAVGYSDDWEHYTLCQSIDASFRLSPVAPIVLVNVLDPAKHIREVEETEIPVVSGKAVLQQSGMMPQSIVVKTEAQTLAVDTDYTLSFDADGSLVITVMKTGAAAAAESMTVSGQALDPEMVTKEDIIGGVDPETGKETGLELVRSIYPMFGMTPGLLLAPGWSHIPEVAAVMQAKCTDINGCYSCETLIDLDTAQAKVYTAAKQAKEKAGINSIHAMALWPMVKVGDKKYYYSAVMGALTAYTDANNDDVPNLSPSNKLISVTAACTADGTEVLLDQTQANLLNSQGITTLLNLGGFRTWGNRTAAYPATTDPKDSWFAVRRFFSWWGNSFILTYFQKVDQPGNYRLIESIVDSENIRGNSYVARGYCARAEILFDESENPVTDILNGQIRFHQYLSPYIPAECILNTMEFDPNALMTALTGGEE